MLFKYEWHQVNYVNEDTELTVVNCKRSRGEDHIPYFLLFFIVIGSWPTSHTKYWSIEGEDVDSTLSQIKPHHICCNKFNCRNGDWTKFWRTNPTRINLQIIIFQIPINHLIIATCYHVWENVDASELSAVVADEEAVEGEGMHNINGITIVQH